MRDLQNMSLFKPIIDFHTLFLKDIKEKEVSTLTSSFIYINSLLKKSYNVW